MNNEHILMVEDSKLILTLVTSKLRSEGYQVTAAANVPEALHATTQALPDLLILDLTLLDGDPFSGLTDGFAFLRLLQRGSPAADLPVIIYSANDSALVHAKAKAFGVAAVVPKGRPIRDLLHTVREVLDERKARPVAPPGCPVPV
jgi:two-component system, OmpR family, KDP operon response regulator KdpE